VVGDRHESFLPRFVFCPRLEEVEKSGETDDFGFVKAEEEYSGECCNKENCLIGGRSPEEAWDFGVVIEVITGGHCRKAIAEHAAGRTLCTPILQTLSTCK
jgi:hypothetical protein